MPNKLEQLEVQTLEEDDSSEVPPSDIVAYNELRSCADLFRMYDQSILEIQPEFQRDIVWAGPMQTRFVDSLVKQLPIPSMCFAQDFKRQRWIVIDGLQRIWTIVRFLKGADWRLSRLDDIDQDLSGTNVAGIKDNQSILHHYYTRVENLSIPITVLRCDFSKANHLSYLFTIFHRLNTGGMKLNNQEIRNCIYGGTLNKQLKILDEYAPWRQLNRMKKGESYRFAKQEMILRFFAFVDRYEEYDGYLARFLNHYMHQNQNANSVFLEEKRTLFIDTVTAILECVFDGIPPKKLPITYMEALLVGIGRNIRNDSLARPYQLSGLYTELINNDVFSDKSLREGLSKRDKVRARLSTAISIFSV